VGQKTRACLLHGHEEKLQMKFSQLSFELGFLQVGLDRLWSLQVKETKRRTKITQMG
jgi:hypothetical protein